MSNLYVEKNTKGLPKWLERLIVVLAVIIITIFIVLYNGNPFDRSKINSLAQQYVQENHPEIRDRVELNTPAYYISPSFSTADPEREWWEGQWYMYFSDPDDEFLRYAMVYNMKKELIFDGYEENYIKGGTIYNRYSNRYREYFVKIFNEVYKDEVKTVGLTMSSIIGGTDGEAYFGNTISNIEDAYTGPVLDVTREYTMEELAAQYGTLQFRYGNDEPTKENLVIRRKEARKIIEEYNIPCKNIKLLIDFSCMLDIVDIDEFMAGDAEEMVNRNFYNIYEDQTENPS